MIKAFFHRNNIYFLAGLASIGFTLLFLAYKQPIDPDGIQYLNAAVALPVQGLKASFQAYHWPFYSILIAAIISVTHLSALSSAHIVNTILDIITVIVFMMLIKELGGSRKLQILSALIILTFPYLNHFRYQVLRGHGYYPFCLLAMLFLIKFLRTYKWRDAIGWGIAIVIATLFRIEGAILTGFLPLILLLKPGLKVMPRIGYCLKAYIVPIILLVVLAILLSIDHHFLASSYSGRIPDLISQFLHSPALVWHALQNRADLLIKTFSVHPSSSKYANLAFLVAGLIGLSLIVLMTTLGLLYSILSGYSLGKKIVPWDWSAKAVWLWAMLLNVIIVLVFAGQQFFVVNRYVALLCFLLLLIVPFAIANIYKHHHKVFVLLVIALIYTMLGGVYHFGTSKTYIVENGEWLQKNTVVTSKLYSNDDMLFFYAKRPGLYIDDSSNQNLPSLDLKQYDYLAIRIARDDKAGEAKVIAYLKLQPIKVFHNRRGDKSLIFKLR